MTKQQIKLSDAVKEYVLARKDMKNDFSNTKLSDFDTDLADEAMKKFNEIDTIIDVYFNEKDGNYLLDEQSDLNGKELDLAFMFKNLMTPYKRFTGLKK